MRVRFLIHTTVLLLILGLPFQAFANELPQASAMPSLAPSPSLPSIDAFGTSTLPNILESARVTMPRFELWEDILIENEEQPREEEVPVAPSLTPIPPSLLATLSWPAYGRVSSGFGARNGRMHMGIDIPLPTGAPIQAAAGGIVTMAGTLGGYGRTVIIDHKNGMKTLYAHNSSLVVAQGEQVERGQIIAYAGSTGNATSSHLHFGVMVEGTYKDPMVFLGERSRLANIP